MDNSKSLGRYLVEEVGGELLEERNNRNRYDAILNDVSDIDNEIIGAFVRRFYLDKGFWSLSGESMMFNFTNDEKILI